MSKRGPDGGVIGIDDPAEVFPPGTKRWLVKEINGALRQAGLAALERHAGREGNATVLNARAARRLADAIWTTLEGGARGAS